MTRPSDISTDRATLAQPARGALIAAAAMLVLPCGAAPVVAIDQEVPTMTTQPANTQPAAPAPHLNQEDGKVWIDGVDRYRVIDPMCEGVRIILTLRGESYSPAYIQGISGIAFQINGICPCAPTCGSGMGPEQLLELLGYEFEKMPLRGKGEQMAQDTRQAVARAHAEIDAGRAVLVWHAFTNSEWDVVYGYEPAKFLGRGSYAGNDKPYASADEKRMSTCENGTNGVIVIGARTKPFDAAAAELAALRGAVRHARSQKNVEQRASGKWAMLEGIACYDSWIREFRDDATKKRGAGDAYCYGVYHSTHRAAAAFLREIAPRHPRATQELLDAASAFETEANTLDGGEKLLWWNSPTGPDLDRNAEAADLLQKARDAYVQGIEHIEKAVALMQ